MSTRTTIRRTVAAVAVAGAITGATGLMATAATATPTVAHCTAGQISTRLVDTGAESGAQNAALRITAKPGQRCALPGTLPVNLSGADNVVTAAADIPPNAPDVVISSGSPAYVPMQWTATAPDTQQQTPNGVSVIEPSTVTPWMLGPVDATPDNHLITYGPVLSGNPPTA